MKRTILCLGFLFAVLAGAALLRSKVSVGQGGGSIEVFSDGSDGAFEPGGPTEVDLGLAATAAWNTPSPTPGRGVYDPDKWAVVFKYSSVSITSTITFKNHPSRAPVVWLVDGDVTISGIVNLDGKSGFSASEPVRLAESGPGGFRGGAAALGAAQSGSGLGPGGSPYSYGNEQILPLIGGPGYCCGGGAGGGAILIAASGTIAVNGAITASGYGMGCGGAIRLIADTVQGSGYITANSNSAVGRTRVEANSISLSNSGNPPYTVGLPGNPAMIWAPESAPRIKVTHIGNVSTGNLPVPADPRSSIDFPNADVSFQTDDPVDVRIEAQNVPTSWKLNMHVIPLHGNRYIVQAAYESGNDQASVWKAQFTPPSGELPSTKCCAIQVRAYKP